MNDRLFQIRELIPKDVNSVLDIGCQERFFKQFIRKYIGLDVKNADINQDLNKTQKIKLKNKSVDLVILSQILEHLADPSVLIKEAKRIAKKCILVGLPNDNTIDIRIKLLFGIHYQEGFSRFGHKHIFTVRSAESFVKERFGKYKLKYHIYGVTGGRLLPLSIRKFLASLFPSLFAKEIYYLFEV